MAPANTQDDDSLTNKLQKVYYHCCSNYGNGGKEPQWWRRNKITWTAKYVLIVQKSPKITWRNYTF